MNPVRVMVVDDSVVARKIVSDVLSSDPAIEVVGTAVNGRTALAKLEQLGPDLIIMDLEMPEMDGIEAVRKIRARHPDLPIIIFGAVPDRGAAAALDALAVGADDWVPKPADVGSVAQATARVRDQLIPRIKTLVGRAPTSGAAGHSSPRVPPYAPAGHPLRVKRPAVLAIASSTGGPEALARLLPALPATFPVPILIVQHMPPVFTRQFAARLDRLSAVRVREAADGDRLVPGEVYVAPGDHHLTVRGAGRAMRLVLDQSSAENYCRPSADRLFRSVGAAYDGAVLAVVLTGMGVDGRSGAAQLRASGGVVLAQDQASSVVWGMPGAVVEAGLADEVVPLHRMASAILRRFAGAAPRPTVSRAAGGVG